MPYTKYIIDGFESYSQKLNYDSTNLRVGDGLKNERKHKGKILIT